MIIIVVNLKIFYIFNIMNNNLIGKLIKLIVVFFISTAVIAGGDDDRDSGPVESLDQIMIYDPCTNDDNNGDIYLQLNLSQHSGFVEGQVFYSNDAAAVVASYDEDNNSLIYFQNSDTGYGSFVESSNIKGINSGEAIIESIVVEVDNPCVEKIVVIEKEPIDMASDTLDEKVFDDNSQEEVLADIAQEEVLVDIAQEEVLADIAQEEVLVDIAQEEAFVDDSQEQELTKQDYCNAENSEVLCAAGSIIPILMLFFYDED